MSSYFVLVASPTLPPVEKTAQIIARFTGGVAFDARLKAKHAWGFLGENLSDEDAGRLAAMAGEAGVTAAVLPADQVVTFLPAPIPVHWLRAAPEALVHTTGTFTEEKAVPWDRVRLVAAAPLKEQITITKTVREGPSDQERMIRIGLSLATGIPLGGGKGKDVKKVTHTSELFLHLDVFVEEEGGLRRLHVGADKFNFSALGAACPPDMLGKFRLLVDTVDRGAGPAFRNRGVRGFLAAEPLTALGYETLDDYNKEIRWLLSIPKA